MISELIRFGYLPDYSGIGSGQNSPREIVRCFPANTPILMADGTSRPISAIAIGDWILAFDPAQPFGALVPRQVTKLFRNTTESWLKLSFLDGGTLSATPGHEMLAADGRFARLDRLVHWNNTGEGHVVLVGEDGAPCAARVERIRFGAATAHLFEQAVLPANENVKRVCCA
jgi:Hint module